MSNTIINTKICCRFHKMIKIQWEGRINENENFGTGIIEKRDKMIGHLCDNLTKSVIEGHMGRNGVLERSYVKCACEQLQAFKFSL